ncbi:MAG: DUF2911 domain-containing protein [Gemmatimonadota bacterium]|nr:DUF2911 domain-containing protein [Gemmatimonadota bacterium]
MRYTFTAVALTIACAASLPAQAALQPAPSTRATSAVTLTYPEGQAPEGAQPMTIRLDYGQPHLRGRMLHSDSLVPYDRPWRTGANEATTLETDVDIIIGGATVPKGKYSLHTLPSRAGWKLVIQKIVAQSETPYDTANDVARIDLRQRALVAPIESLSMWLIPSRAPGVARGELRLAWGTVELSTDWSVK